MLIVVVIIIIVVVIIIIICCGTILFYTMNMSYSHGLIKVDRPAAGQEVWQEKQIENDGKKEGRVRTPASYPGSKTC